MSPLDLLRSYTRKNNTNVAEVFVRVSVELHSELTHLTI